MLSAINMLISSLGDYLVDEMTQSNESTREVFSNKIDKLETNIKQFHEESQKKSDEILSLLQKQELSKKEFESPLIEKNECKYCNRKKNGRFDTCCQACINGSHTADCHGRNECKRNDKRNDEKNKSTDNLEIASKQPEIQQEQHQEEDHQEEDHQQEQHQEENHQEENHQEEQQEEEREEKNQFTEETDSMKFRRILFTYHYGHNFNPFICIFCQKDRITREEFKVVRLGYDYCGNPNAIEHVLPVCLNCDGHRSKKNRVKNRLLIDRRQRKKYFEKNNLVSSDEMLFVRNHNDINTFPLV